MHDYITTVLTYLDEIGPLTWHQAVRFGWSVAEFNVGKAGARRRVLLRAVEKQWIAAHGDKIVITPNGRRELRDALRAF